VPKSVNEAMEIDKEIGTGLWKKAIEKEMRNMESTFRILNDNEKVPIRYQLIRLHIGFDVKMNITRNVQFTYD
jgi:hypothetical protein